MDDDTFYVPAGINRYALSRFAARYTAQRERGGKPMDTPPNLMLDTPLTFVEVAYASDENFQKKLTRQQESRLQAAQVGLG